MIKEWCLKNKGNLSSWGASEFLYRKDEPATYICKKGNMKISMLHIYGSLLKGPYYCHGWHLNDSYVDTELRLDRGLELYSSLHGDPNYVFFRTDYWDMAYNLHVKPYIPSSPQMLSNYKWAIHNISSHFPLALIGTHTIPKNKIGHDGLSREFQDFVRYDASLHGLFLFDWELLFKNLSPDIYLKDKHHPRQKYLISFADIVINSCFEYLCFTDYFKFKRMNL
jgi:hypothetical protein